MCDCLKVTQEASRTDLLDPIPIPIVELLFILLHSPYVEA